MGIPQAGHENALALDAGAAAGGDWTDAGTVGGAASLTCTSDAPHWSQKRDPSVLVAPHCVQNGTMFPLSLRAVRLRPPHDTLHFDRAYYSTNWKLMPVIAKFHVRSNRLPPRVML